MIVAKAVNMASLMNVPILGVIENYSYYQCPDCGKTHEIFGHSNIERYAKEHGVDVLDRMPIDPRLSALCDKGIIELFENDYLANTADKLESL